MPRRRPEDDQQTAPGSEEGQSPTPPPKGPKKGVQRACLWCYRLYSPRKGYECCSAVCQLKREITWAGLPACHFEHRFAKPRRFRFDFAFIEQMIAVEVHGATWSGGRHARGAGIASDCEKRNLAQRMGWRVYEFTSDQVMAGEAIRLICEVLDQK